MFADKDRDALKVLFRTTTAPAKFESMVAELGEDALRFALDAHLDHGHVHNRALMTLRLHQLERDRQDTREKRTYQTAKFSAWAAAAAAIATALVAIVSIAQCMQSPT